MNAPLHVAPGSTLISEPGVATTSSAAVLQGEGGAAVEAAPSAAGLDPRQQPTVHPRVIGADLSLTATGMSDGRTTWTVRSTGHSDDTLYQRDQRLRRLRAEIVSHCENAQLVVVEAPSFGSQHGHAHDRSGLWWTVVRALRHRGIDVVEIPPTVVKMYATGKGNADKGAVIDATSRQFPDINTAGDSNRCDAQWLWALGAHHLTGQAPAGPTVVRDRALGKVRWPATAADR
jgi:crossover junction endodeoxyribonuclease RuvC